MKKELGIAGDGGESEPTPDGRSISESSSAAGISAKAVADAHSSMAQEYDHLDDLWYPWLFAQVHELIARHLPRTPNDRPRALDVGCGTGFQSFLLARAGYDVLGIDLSEGLLALAEEKCDLHARPPLIAPPLFSSSCWPGLDAHHARLGQLLEAARQERSVARPRFERADATTFDYGEAAFDVVVCCGSVLSFIDSYPLTILRMAKALVPGGLLFLEVEQKANLDLLWPVVDILSGGRLGYEQSWSEARRNLSSPGRSVRVDYPFELQNGEDVTLPIWLFADADLRANFRQAGLRVERALGIHWATNLLPSTVLHRPAPSRLLARGVRLLERVDGLFGRGWPACRLGCSAAFVLRRDGVPGRDGRLG